VKGLTPTQRAGADVLCTDAVRHKRALQLLGPLTVGGRIVNPARGQWYIVLGTTRLDVIPRHVVRQWVRHGVIEATGRDSWVLTQKGQLAMAALAGSRT
jgi:hypothetical protein